LQGTTRTNTSGTPFERPQEFEGRRLEDVTAKEIADAAKKVRRTRSRTRNSSAAIPKADRELGGFRDIYEVSRAAGRGLWSIHRTADSADEARRRAPFALPAGVGGLNGPKTSSWTAASRGMPDR
jgi:hypothetical protein